jgi:hypothetical protein
MSQVNASVPLLAAASALGLVSCAWLAPPADPSYTHVSSIAYDGARQVQSSDFERNGLLGTFRQFAAAECKGRTLARLIAGGNSRVLASGLNVDFPEANPAEMVRKGLFHFDFDDPEIAQVLCFDGQETAYVRLRGNVSRFQIAGERDARELVIGGVKLTLVGFNLRVPSHDSSPEQTLPESLTLFVQADQLPDLRMAEQIHAQLETKAGTGIFLVLRTDPFFLEDDGPAWDVFAKSLPSGSAEPFLSKNRINCPPRTTGGHCLQGVAAPSLPAEHWGTGDK